MRILLVDFDSHHFPNLALMKISAWMKEQGHTTHLIKGPPDTAPLDKFDEVFISCIFPQNAEFARDYAFQCETIADRVSLGGSGVDYTTRLPDAIEHTMPDYHLYGIDFSLGFTSRGCLRNCPWCIVPKKEGMIRDHAPIAEFLHPEHKKVILLDNNFQASPRWRENLHYVQEQDLKINFNQGLDARLMDEEFAEELAKTKYYNWTFKQRGLHLACDTPQALAPLERAIDLLDAYGVRPSHIMVYVLVGFNTTISQDFQRIYAIKDLGAVPYIMRYNQTKTPILSKMARWVNRLYYQFIPWGDYQQ